MNIFKRKYITEDNTKYLDGWVRFYNKFNHSFFITKAGYFDERPEVNTSLTQLLFLLIVPISSILLSPLFLLLTPFIFFGWGKLYIKLPIKTGIDDSDSAAWGTNYHDRTFWIYIGGGGNFDGGRKWITFEMPWSYQWYRTSILLKDETWINEFKGDRKDFYDSKWDSQRWIIKAEYLDTHDGEVVGATLKITEREWRRKWLMFLPLFNRIYKSLEVEFDKEVGSRKGTWKGGTIGTSFKIEAKESIFDAMERHGFTCLSINRNKKIDRILN